MNDIDLQTPQLYINRELSFLEFNQRVLEQAKDNRIPLLERVRFLCISCANLDEFFEIRVASLKELLEAGAVQGGPDGLSVPEQLKAIRSRTARLVNEQYQLLNDVLMPELAKNGVVFLSPETGPRLRALGSPDISAARSSRFESAGARPGAAVSQSPQQELEFCHRRRGGGRLWTQQRPCRRPGAPLAAAPHPASR